MSPKIFQLHSTILYIDNMPNSGNQACHQDVFVVPEVNDSYEDLDDIA
jgi:hypothetical protein